MQFLLSLFSTDNPLISHNNKNYTLITEYLDVPVEIMLHNLLICHKRTYSIAGRKNMPQPASRHRHKTIRKRQNAYHRTPEKKYHLCFNNGMF